MNGKYFMSKREEMVWCLLLFVFPYSALAISNVIQTSTGKVEGTTVSYEDKDIQAFLGIPFAKPPTGEFRFRKTVPVEPWEGTYQAKNFSSACFQAYPPDFPWVDNMPNQSENCLYLNIWVPPNTNNGSEKKSVMFWIHAGGFSRGSNRLAVYNGQVLSSEGNVIVVTTNYRLSVLGFLSSNSSQAPGNMGLYDMLEALKWVNNNIEAFGGDSKGITVFGESVGAIAAGLLCVSPLAKGLFQRVILESSSSANDLSNMAKQHNNLLAQKLAEKVGCETKGQTVSDNLLTEDVIKCLKSKDAKLLVEETETIHVNYFGFWAITGDDFVPLHPKLQLKAGNFNDADVLIGHNQDEGSYFFAKICDLLGENNPQFNKTTGRNYIRKMLSFYPAKEQVVQHYLGDDITDDNVTVREQTYHSIGDYLVVCPDIYFGECYAKKGNAVYAYYFNHIPSVTPWHHWMGSVHFDEVAFVFGRPLDNPSKYTAGEQHLSRRMVNIWTNFAKRGNPGSDWEKFSRQNQYFKVLMTDDRKSYLEEHKKNCEFFRKFEGFETT